MLEDEVRILARTKSCAYASLDTTPKFYTKCLCVCVCAYIYHVYLSMSYLKHQLSYHCNCLFYLLSFPPFLFSFKCTILEVLCYTWFSHRKGRDPTFNESVPVTAQRIFPFDLYNYLLRQG